MIRKIGLIGRTYRHINRYREIIAVLFKHGFGDLITNSQIEKYLDFGKKFIPNKKIEKITSLSRWERIRMVLEELGPTFIKLGQIMSNRPDILPEPLLFELEKLQDSVPPMPNEEAEKMIEQELGKPISELFKKFDTNPIASASIAQVYRAELFSGEKIAVKVQRTGIQKIIETDLEIMFHLSLLMEKHITEMQILNPVEIVKEFERSIRKEIDFNIEASHIERFGRNFQTDLSIYVPEVYKDHSTKKILTMEFIEGIKVSNLNGLIKAENDPLLIAGQGCDLILKQIFEHGFFHADPHPGNILIMKDNITCFLDFGMMGTLLPKHQDYLGNIIVGVVNKDSKKITETLLRLTGTYNIENRDQLEYRVSELVNQYAYISLKEIKIGELLNKLFKMLIDFKLRLPSDFYLLSKALITIEGVGTKLDPDFDMVAHIEPFAKNLLKKRLDPFKLAKDLYSSMSEFRLLFKDFPFEIREIIRLVKTGKLKIEFEHKGLESMLIKHDQISNRIAFTIVLAALIIGSSLIVLSKIPPLWQGIPIIGIVGYIAAGIMGFWLLISILKHGKM
ncbi:MAG: AarF/ABC1/UbiB kinase family protein [Candidatus Cloacimonetes bacterium]|nr:AarF/ABC1/UbiB kinase family protein [Candidatus Cloacimonadota bacterium]